MAPIDLTKRCFCVISGGSKGIGSAMAIALAKKFAPNSKIVLMARSVDKMNETKAEILAANNQIEVATVEIDLERPSETHLKNVLFSTYHEPIYEVAIVIHNVGTIGDIQNTSAETCGNTAEWEIYFQMNLISVIMLNTFFLKMVKNIPTKLVVNVTSLCAVEPMKSLVLYCTGKASREMYFKVLGLENPNLTVLNYSPGMVDTDMGFDFRTKSSDEEIKKFAQNVYDTNQYIQPLQTAERFIEIVTAGKYKNGAHVDYHDPIEN